MTTYDRFLALLAADSNLPPTDALRMAVAELVGPPARRWGDEGEYIARHEAQEPERA